MPPYTLHLGDNLATLRAMPGSSVDSIVSDPPYGLSFMGKKWDYDVPSVELWQECLRVLKPGGHLLAFAGTRTQHRMAVRIEDAGFEIRDMIAWVYGSGFPKSLDVSKAIDKAAGAEREVVGLGQYANRGRVNASNQCSVGDSSQSFITTPATDAARQWQGWGTALKPALEPITVARKPLVGTVAENVLTHGTGAINVDGCRVGTDGGTTRSEQAPYSESGWRTGHKVETLNASRWPANLIHDGSEEVTELFPQQSGVVGARREGGDKSIFNGGGHQQAEKQRIVGGIKDSGSAARFFYCAKASKADRDEGNIHPTVKPTDLMRYLCRLVTPPGGVVLDPFMGSGSTGKAAMLEGFRFIGCELSEEYFKIADARISAALASQPLL
jgi:site-specific DNA-methyltransferase (adenine-specific)